MEKRGDCWANASAAFRGVRNEKIPRDFLASCLGNAQLQCPNRSIQISEKGVGLRFWVRAVPGVFAPNHPRGYVHPKNVIIFPRILY